MDPVNRLVKYPTNQANFVFAFGSALPIFGLVLASISVFNLLRRFNEIHLCSPIPLLFNSYETIFHSLVEFIPLLFDLRLPWWAKDLAVLWAIGAGSVLRIATPIFQSVRALALDARRNESLTGEVKHERTVVPSWASRWKAGYWAFIAFTYLFWPAQLFYSLRNNLFVYTQNLGTFTYLWYDYSFIQLNGSTIREAETVYNDKFCNAVRQGWFKRVANLRIVFFLQSSAIAILVGTIYLVNGMVCRQVG